VSLRPAAPLAVFAFPSHNNVCSVMTRRTPLPSGWCGFEFILHPEGQCRSSTHATAMKPPGLNLLKYIHSAAATAAGTELESTYGNTFILQLQTGNMEGSLSTTVTSTFLGSQLV